MAPFPGIAVVVDAIAASASDLLDSRDASKSSPPSKTTSSRLGNSTPYRPGLGAKSPDSFDNNGFFALFALIGAAMVVTGIWFFFWAPNGGFVWRKGDWDDYKSTVLRRKGKDGKTLSNATKTTDLGQKSIAGTFDIEKDYMDLRDQKYNGYGREEKMAPNAERERRPNGTRREPSDEDMRAYRQEKPARVGGINRVHEGSHFDYSSTDLSSIVSDNSARHLRQKHGGVQKKSPLGRKNAKKQARKSGQDAKFSGAVPTQAQGDRRDRRAQRKASIPLGDESPRFGSGNLAPGEANGLPDSYYAAYRAPASPGDGGRDSPRRYHSPRQGRASAYAPGKPANNPRQSSPQKGSPLGCSDASSDTGTKIYNHHIPGLSKAAQKPGFRRGGQSGRRDSLEDSDGEFGFRRA